MLGDLVSDYTVEVVYNFTPEVIDYVVDLCDRRSKELRELGDNYTAERLRACFEEDRFKYGFYIVKLQDEVVATFGIGDFRGWAVITRYIVHKPGKWLFIGGAVFPFIQKELEGKVIGICHTQNKDSRKMRNIMAERLLVRNSGKEYDPLTAKGATVEFLKHTKKLDYDVWYRGTVQEVVTYYTDLIPPFERYSGSL